MASPDDLANLALYKELMEEAKARILSINTLTNDQRGIPSPLVREFCFLQLRMTCELIALGCLVAHGDIVAESPAALRKAYRPPEILARLSEIHPDFYPVPGLAVRTTEGWHLGEMDGRPVLTKDGLNTLWVECGDILHRGSLKKLIGPRTPYQTNFADVNSHGQKILNLLSAHRILRQGGRLIFLTFLQVNDLGGAVQVAIGEIPPEPVG